MFLHFGAGFLVFVALTVWVARSPPAPLLLARPQVEQLWGALQGRLAALGSAAASMTPRLAPARYGHVSGGGGAAAALSDMGGRVLHSLEAQAAHAMHTLEAQARVRMHDWSGPARARRSVC
jgi:hypothetical protein